MAKKRQARKRTKKTTGPAPVDGAAPPRRRRRRGRRGGRGRGRARTGSYRTVARERFGIRTLRPEQVTAIEALLADRDVLAVLPTGFGKSLIYQVPAMLLDRPTIVVSPLIALMQDQETSLRARKIPVVRLDSTLRKAERCDALERIAGGGALVILTTPETLESADARPFFERARAGLLCVDEAHCISEWGHDFRPAYLRIGAERRALDIPLALGLTATATPRVQQDIVKRLGLDDPVTVTGSSHRPNLRLSAHIAPGADKFDRAGRLLRRMPRPAIVYCATKRAVDDVYGALVRARIACDRYHGGMRTAERDEAQRRFMRKDRRAVMVATSAFGMGIDKPDIRSIMHFHAPASIEQYVQEAGRAGRDGRPSRCVLLYEPADLEIQSYLQSRSRPNAAQLRRIAKAMMAWSTEGRAVEAKTLALAAKVPQTTCRSLCAQLEEAGLVVRERGQGYRVDVAEDALRRGSNDLARRFEIERRQDERRLRAVTEYAETEECRSAFLRRWFGEEDPPRCGTCDRCQAAGGGGGGGGGSATKRKRRRRRRRRR